MNRRPRAPGTTKLRQLLETYTDPPPTRSEFERDFYALIEQTDLPRPLVNTLVAGQLVDMYWPQYRLVVELDSRTYHTRVRDFERGAKRDAILMRAGLQVLHVTWRRLRDERQAVLGDVIALARRKAA